MFKNEIIENLNEASVYATDKKGLQEIEKNGRVLAVTMFSILLIIGLFLTIKTWKQASTVSKYFSSGALAAVAFGLFQALTGKFLSATFLDEMYEIDTKRLTPASNS